MPKAANFRMVRMDRGKSRAATYLGIEAESLKLEVIAKLPRFFHDSWAELFMDFIDWMVIVEEVVASISSNI